MPEVVCPLCHSAALTVPLSDSNWRYTCPKCATFEMGDLGLTTFRDREHWDETRVQLSKAARKSSDEGHPLKLTNVQSLLEAIAQYHVGATR
jgi:hypothetical protein